ncbi:hypothetical protein SteCoe_5704 [Stentor coeruleus]|uniref:Tetrapyrrole methylase domain-containing protein n=1 Tax=Stentor coeruleus TaxID=5963 RepID=A0A1R2CRQ8_9CILI|nr:hypothetical protein SteCoe_5704 [Stentor coeruleus]
MKLFHILRRIGRKIPGQTLYENNKKGLEEKPLDLKDKIISEDHEDIIKSLNTTSSRVMLTICPTPIGDLRDISIRQYQALRNADILACGDTRLTSLLLHLLNNLTFNEAKNILFPPSSIPESSDLDEYKHCLAGDLMSHTIEMIKKVKEEKNRGIMVSLNTENHEQRTPILIKAMKSGIRVVLVSDSGTPLVSDSGYAFVKDAIKHGVSIESLPGPVAAITALTLSGFPTDNFFFQGNMPKTYPEKAEKLERIKKNACTSILYESSDKILKTTEAISKVYGNMHPIFIGQELTKPLERFYRGTAGEVVQQLKQEIESKGEIHGEMSIVIAPIAVVKKKNSINIDVAKVLETLNYYVQGKPRDIVKIASAITGWSENRLLKFMIKINQKKDPNYKESESEDDTEDAEDSEDSEDK